MASEHVLDVVVRRYVLDSERPFPAVLDGIFGGISQPDIGALFSNLAASTSYEQFSALVRLIAGNSVTMEQMTRHVPDAGSYAPVTILHHAPGGTRVADDSVASALAPHHDAAASQVARRLDTEVLGLLRQVTGVPSSANA